MRDLKTRREVSDWLTRQLKDYPGCGETMVTVQYQLVEPDPEGGNRSRDWSVNYGRDDNFIVHEHLRPLFEEARRRFNVLAP